MESNQPTNMFFNGNQRRVHSGSNGSISSSISAPPGFGQNSEEHSPHVNEEEHENDSTD